MGEKKPVVFGLNSELYGVDIDRVVGIERQQNVVRVPNTVDYIKGIINLRGEIIAVLDLRQKFGLAPMEAGRDRQYIVVRVKDSMVALEVDGVKEIHNVELEDAFPMPGIIQKGDTNYFEEVIKSDKSLIVIVNVDKLFTSEELEKIGEIVKQ